MSKLAISFAALATALSAATINVKSTGLTAEGSVDPNWVIVTPSGSAFVTVTDGFPITGSLWIANDAQSRWIEPDGGTVDSHPDNTPFTYRTTFSLTGLIPGTALLTFQAAADNEITAVRLNGNSLGFLHNDGITSPFTAFNTWSAVQTVNNPAFFLGGLNTLEFDVKNTTGNPNPTGLRVLISGTADPFSDPPPDPAVPEPATITLMAAGLGAIALLRRNR